MTYSEKLKDPRWQKKRLEVMQRDKFQCIACGRSNETLHIHHLIYSKGEPWETDAKYMETLCATCHGARTEDDSIRTWMIRTRPTKEVITEEARQSYLDCISENETLQD